MKKLKYLAVFEAIIGLSAVVGGYGLISTNGLGMPHIWLEGTLFSSYIIPGLILTFIVGGTSLASSVLTWKNHRYAPEGVAIAGFGLLIWIFTEMYIIADGHWLQAIYFSFSVILLISTMFILKFQKGGYE